MPMYTYRCKTCGREEDRIVKVAERDNQTCEEQVEPTLRDSRSKEVSVLCGGLMSREEVSLIGKSAYAWR